MNYFKIIFDIIQKLISATLSVQWYWWTCGIIVTIICVIYNAVKYPEAALNLWICRVIDMIVGQLPRTPANYKLGYMFSQVMDNTDIIGSATVSEIFSGIMGMLAIYLVWKVYRSLPFI